MLKKLLFSGTFLIGLSLSAQINLVDMELDTPTSNADANVGLSWAGDPNAPTSAAIANNNSTGINTSANIVEYVNTLNAHKTNGVKLHFTSPNATNRTGFNLSTYKFMKFKMYSPTTKTSTIRVTLGHQPNLISYDYDVSLTANTWREVVMDFTGNHADDTVNNLTGWNVQFIISIDPDVVGDGASYYFDDFTLEHANYETVAAGDYNTPANFFPASVPVDHVKYVDFKHNMTYTGNLSIDDFLIRGSRTLDITGDLAITDEGQMWSGAQLKVSGTASGNIRYLRTLSTTNWYLIGMPFGGETFEDFITLHPELATGNNGNIGIGTYDNTQADANDRWTYKTAASTGSITAGQGMAIKRGSTGDMRLVGTVNTSDVAVPITVGAGDAFNLLGNPYSCSVAINNNADATNNLLKVNDTDNDYLSESTIWMWDQGSGSYTSVNQSTGATYLSPGQAFFVSAGGSHSFSFTEAMQSIQTDDFQKTVNLRPEIHLNVSDGSLNRKAQILYIDGTSKEFDNGYDSSLFAGGDNSLAIYTHLLTNDLGKSYQIQSLPNTELENMIVPIGINADAGQEIVLSLDALNLPSGLKVFLEDRVANTFTRLDEANSFYKVTLSEEMDGVGRFYLHTKSSVLSTSDLNLDTISIYTTGNSNLRISGLSQGKSNVKLYNILGKQVMNRSFNSSNVNDISLPSLAKGIYIVQLETENGMLNKKITLE